LTGAIGVAGGVLLGRKGARGRKVLGVPVPEKVDMSGLSQSIGEAGRQFGKLAGELRSAREKAEQIGKILT
jgi:hypothetical protein